MKLFVTLILVFCLAFAGFVPKEEQTTASAEQAGNTVETTVAPTPAEPSYKGLDFEKLHALHAEDEVVAEINGRAVTWEEYFYWLYTNAVQMDQQMTMLAYYGQEPDWNQEFEGKTISQITTEETENIIKTANAMESLNQKNGLTLTEEDQAELRQRMQEEIQTNLGEDAGEEEFNEMLAEMYMPREIYDRINQISFLFRKGLTEIYGENGELSDPDAVVNWLEQNGYINASHILFLTMDMSSREPLDEETVAEKKEMAEAVAAEMAAIEDPQELVAYFAQVKAEKCEDTGKEQFPDGYTFTQGTMVPEFEESCLSMEPYGVSGVVETSYGYHVILRLPLRADSLVTVGSSAVNASLLYAEEQYNAAREEEIDAMELVFVPGFQAPDLSNFVLE